MKPRENVKHYRKIFKGDGLVYFNCKVKQSDLYIGAEYDLKEQAEESIRKYRQQVEEYIRKQPVFLHSLEPVEPLPGAPEIISHMCRAAAACGVGPMAAIAGAVSYYVAKDLIRYTGELVVENGGDIYIVGKRERVVGIYAGKSALTGKIGIKISPENLPVSICTSSGTVGHSLSFGSADAAVILSKDACLADAAATAAGNMVSSRDDIERTINKMKMIPGISGILIVIGEDVGVWGNIVLVRL
ncbi:MAG TPA: hypothetical protein DCE11_01315 [Ruminiclostridium sp.]|jgi:ApbE superfamily uncharacterized protein (UPF0280 family)|nr:UPF0280 family protein [Clostridiaceae bacterium]HAA24745.1 hypothetical protein [Ruminiclostridium sp.]